MGDKMRNHKVINHDTRWYGVTVVEENGHFWILIDSCDYYMGTTFPTDSMISEQLDMYLSNN